MKAKKIRNVWGFILLTLLALVAASCARQPKAWVSQVQTQSLGDIPSVSPEVASAPVVTVVATVDKKAILEQDFLYGADLQYSSLYDADADLYQQSMAIGHTPARFRVVGSELQLIADTRPNYPSDVNHPEKLLSRFNILQETETTLTISGANSSAYLGQAMNELDPPAPGKPAPLPQDHWIRSFSYEAKDSLLLQQTSVLLTNGKIAEFMESILPASAVAPSPKFQVFQMDPANPVGGDEGFVARFRFLAGEKVYDGEEVMTFAQHFDLPEGGTIDWYVTRNIPDEFIEPVKNAVEGWNRYFLKFKGIERKVVLFKGKLPDGVALGDPRYNVINWDSRLVAGAAYESQAVNPLTGKQSHSLIYLPAAWVKIGTDYWKKGIASDPVTEALHRPKRGLRARIPCARDLRQGAALAVSGRLTEEEITGFATQLLKQTLFHEVGHALGLAHNFKGSLAYDRSKPGTLFSSSIMDYNDFEIERRAFTSVDSADGPLLEYDRQALSALYNQGRDLENTEVIPACNDAEADNEEGGVDPLCMRYDVEHDPTLSVETAFKRIVKEKLEGDVSLTEALRRIPALAFSGTNLEEVKTADDLLNAASSLASGLKATLNFYIVAGQGGLSRVVRANIKSLLSVADDALLDGYDIVTMRDRAFTGVERALSFTELNASTKTAITEAVAAGMAKLGKSAYLQSLSSEEAQKLLILLSGKVEAKVLSFTTDKAAGLPKLRAAVLTTLARHQAVPFYFGKASDKLVDYEKALIALLQESVPASSHRTDVERLAAAKSLATYNSRPDGAKALKTVRAKLLEERATASNNEERELVEQLLKAL